MAIVKLYDKKGKKYEFETQFKTVFIPRYVLKDEEVKTIKYIPEEKNGQAREVTRWILRGALLARAASRSTRPI